MEVITELGKAFFKTVVLPLGGMWIGWMAIIQIIKVWKKSEIPPIVEHEIDTIKEKLKDYKTRSNGYHKTDGQVAVIISKLEHIERQVTGSAKKTDGISKDLSHLAGRFEAVENYVTLMQKRNPIEP
jgi:hypothetical protein